MHVYETHARIALEEGDLTEFNQVRDCRGQGGLDGSVVYSLCTLFLCLCGCGMQCQSQLHELYTRGYEGQRLEFLGYRLLYILYEVRKPSGNEAHLAPGLHPLIPCLVILVPAGFKPQLVEGPRGVPGITPRHST